MPPLLHPELLATLEELAQSAPSRAALEEEICRRLAQLPHYDWVGFYWLDPADERMLVLGSFVGAPTEHVRIPVSEGICGAAVREAATVTVDDVQADSRYIACSLETRSEIVVPIAFDGRIVGELDIDSHTPAAFDPSERAFVEQIARLLADYLARHPASL